MRIQELRNIRKFVEENGQSMDVTVDTPLVEIMKLVDLARKVI